MYSFESRIRYSESDCEGKLTMASLLNYFQDCSTFQSEDLGLGLGYMKEINKVWVLSSWQIVVDRYPNMGERVQTATLPYDFRGFLGSRNFFMKTLDGEYLARANSLWSLLDVATNKPSVPTDAMREGYVVEEKIPMDYAPRKIVIPQDGVFREPIVVKKHHLDTNHHVNNGQYVDIAMDFLPENFTIRQLRAEYKMQAFLDDVFRPYVVEQKDKCVVALMNGADKPYVVVEFTGVNAACAAECEEK